MGGTHLTSAFGRAVVYAMATRRAVCDWSHRRELDYYAMMQTQINHSDAEADM